MFRCLCRTDAYLLKDERCELRSGFVTGPYIPRLCAVSPLLGRHQGEAAMSLQGQAPPLKAFGAMASWRHMASCGQRAFVFTTHYVLRR